MKRRRLSTCSVIPIIFLLFVSMVIPTGVAEQNTTVVVTKREAAIPVKVVMLGVDRSSVNLDYLDWNNPQTRYQLTVLPGISTDTTYSVKYDVTFAAPQFLQEFSSYLRSVGKSEQRTNVLWNETYFPILGSYFLNYTHHPVNAVNTYYPADETEKWLVDHAQEYGGLADAGYTLMIADLSAQLPSVTPDQFERLSTDHGATITPHFYNKTFKDNDLGIQLNRRYMTAWGGHERFFFIDLSAGPGSAAEQLPVQLAAWVNNIGKGEAYSSNWLTQYVADYISGAVYNVFLPDFIYPLNFAENYRIETFIFDNRSRDEPPIESTVDANEIKTQLSSLLPFANVEVDLHFSRLSGNEGLSRAVALGTSPSLAGIYPIVDARIVYDWLSPSGQGHIGDFTTITRNSRTYDIPVFVFAFDRNYTFGFTYKELIANEADFDRTIWGVALYDLVLISHSADDFRRGDLVSPVQPGLGFGFTNTITHEVGHMLGLMHPFATSYDPTENFVSSVMAYYPYEDAFSQFDKDALMRGYADLFIRNTSELLKSTSFIFLNAPDINAANSRLNDAEKSYSEMDYESAAQSAYHAYANAARAQLLGGGGQLTQSDLAIGTGVLGLIIGAATILLVTRRQRTRTSDKATKGHTCTICGRRLTWIPQYQRWYCYRCERYE